MSEAVATYMISPPVSKLTTRYGYRCNADGMAERVAARMVRERQPNRRSRDPKLAESILHSAWRKAGGRAASIAGLDGHRYRIIYAGRPADGAGPDFRDAVLLRDDGVQVHGDVEIHVRSGEWHGHGHGRDAAYNGVVLHVALEETGAPVQTQSGMRIPLLLLKRSFVDTEKERQRRVEADRRPESIESPLAATPLPILDMAVAGDEWFKNRSHGNMLQISVSGADQALWEGALECLGYPANKKGFRQVASRLNWKTISSSLASMQQQAITDLFLWAGGFGPKPVSAPELSGPAPTWASRHGRPANHPRNRLAAAATWAVRWHENGGPANTFETAVRKAAKPGDLLSVFTVPAAKGEVSLLGKARASDAVVNQLLPAVHAMAVQRGDTRLAAHAKRLFDVHPPLQSNSITREASRMLRLRHQDGNPRTARDQQGLIHIYRMATASQRPNRQLPLL